MDVLIKNVNQENWKKFKIEAINRDRNLGELFNELVDDIKSAEGNWEKIKKSKGSLTDKEAEEMKKHMKEFRKGFEFRY